MPKNGSAGGVGMTLVTLSTTVSDYTDMIWAGLEGVGHGGAMFLNAITLNSYLEYLDGMGIPLDARQRLRLLFQQRALGPSYRSWLN